MLILDARAAILPLTSNLMNHPTKPIKRAKCRWRTKDELIMLYSHLQRHNDKDAGRTSFEKYSPLTLLQGFERLACERMLETEHKLHILTPLLWQSCCVFLVLLMFGSNPSGLSEDPLGRVWPSLPHLVSNPLGVFWQLHRGFPRSPLDRVWPSLPHLVSNPLGVCWQLLWDPNSTELNNNSTPTRSPTGSLKSNV